MLQKAKRSLVIGMKRKIENKRIQSLLKKQPPFAAINQVVKAQPFAVSLMLVKCIQKVRAMVFTFRLTAARSFLRSAAVFTFAVILSACSYTPVVDHRGLKGKEVAHRYTDDLHICKSIAKKNNSSLDTAYTYLHNYYIRPSLFFLPDKRKVNYNNMVKTCMTNRGHSILR